MNKDILNIKDTEDLMGFSSPEVVLNHDPKPVLQPFVQDASISNDPFEFILQKAFQNKENSPFVPQKHLTTPKSKLTVGCENSPLFPKENLPKPKLSFKLGDETSPLLSKENLTKWKQGCMARYAIQNSPRLTGKVSKPKFEFSLLNESMMNELDTSYDLLNGSYNLNETFADLTFTAPLRRRSSSMGNLTTYGLPISFDKIKKEANKVVSLLNDPKFILNETPKEEMLSDVMPRLNNSTSSEDEIGLPKILKLSGNVDTSFDLKQSEEYKRYRKLSTSLNNITQTEISNTTIEKEDTFTVDSISEENKITNEKPLKIESKIKLLQKGIKDLPKSLKTVKKPAEKIVVKKGPIKAFPPVNVSQKLNSTNKTITRPSTCPIRKNPNDSNSSIIVPVASSTPDKKGSNLSRNSSMISRPRSASVVSSVLAPKPAITRPPIKAAPRSALGNQRKIPTVGGLKKN